MINYTGLRKRDSYDEIINYLQTDQPKIKYPNRNATVLLNTPQYSSLLELDGLNEQEEQLKKAKIIQATGATQLTQYFNLTDLQQGPSSVHSQHPLGPAAQSVAASVYSDPGVFSAPDSNQPSSSHGAPDENPSDYGSVFGSDIDSHIEQQQTNIQQQQAQIANIAQASLNIQSLVQAHSAAQSASSSSGVNPPNQNPAPLVDATPIAETETEPEKPEKPEKESAIPDTVSYNPKSGAVANTMNWLGKLTSEESKRVAALDYHYKSFTVEDLRNLYHMITDHHISLTSKASIKRSLIMVTMINKKPMYFKNSNGQFVPV